jgi:multimeric flavodoxin WrbA
MRKKKKKILILLGSPREDGNSTRLAFAFADGASAAGHTVQAIHVPALRIRPCDGCDQCWQPATVPCIIRDDMDSVYPLLREADVLVWATPLHFFCWSAPLKTLLDRLYCLSPSHKKNLKGKASILLATGADSTLSAFTGLKAAYRLSAEHMKWVRLGSVLVPGVHEEGAIAELQRYLTKAQRMGTQLT